MTIESVIVEKLAAAFEPVALQVENESYKHNVPPGSESHFKVILVSAQFAGKRQVPCHQMVYKILADELAGEVHALSLHTFSPEDWKQQNPDSPDCMGGGK